jgi:prepilin-type N-terminal cleavage/methylation domain-containing protein
LIKDIQKMRNEKGFTLIELLVVIVILGILAAVVVFAVGGLNDKGESSACKIDTRTLRTAEEAYFAKFSVYALPLAADGPDTDTDGAGNADVDTDTADSAEAKLITAKLLSQPASDYHDIVAGADALPAAVSDPYAIVISNPATASSAKCAPTGTAPGTVVNGTTIK